MIAHRDGACACVSALVVQEKSNGSLAFQVLYCFCCRLAPLLHISHTIPPFNHFNFPRHNLVIWMNSMIIACVSWEKLVFRKYQI
jgi:hypothetical protein